MGKSRKQNKIRKSGRKQNKNRKTKKLRTRVTRRGGMSAAAAAYSNAMRKIERQKFEHMRRSNKHNSYRYVNPKNTRQLYYNHETGKYKRLPPKPSIKNNS